MTPDPITNGNDPAPPPPTNGDGPPPPPPKTFDEEYVRKLREENAERRTAFKQTSERAERLAKELLEAKVSAHATGLIDPLDLIVYVDRSELVDDDGLPDPAKIEAATRDLLERKPHLDARRPTGDIDQGPTGDPPKTGRSFTDLLKQAAG